MTDLQCAELPKSELSSQVIDVVVADITRQITELETKRIRLLGLRSQQISVAELAVLLRDPQGAADVLAVLQLAEQVPPFLDLVLRKGHPVALVAVVARALLGLDADTVAEGLEAFDAFLQQPALLEANVRRWRRRALIDLTQPTY